MINDIINIKSKMNVDHIDDDMKAKVAKAIEDYKTDAVPKKYKEKANLSTSGHIDHGKTTLTSAMTKFSADMFGGSMTAYDQIDNAPDEKARGITIKAAHILVITALRLVSVIDCPGHQDFMRNMITASAGADGAVVVVSAKEGKMPQTTEHLTILKNLKIRKLVVWISKVDELDNEDREILVQLVEDEVSTLVRSYGFEEFEIISGSAWCYLQGTNPELGFFPMLKLFKFMDTLQRNKEKDGEKFVVAIENRYNTQRGKVGAGPVLQGKIKYKPGGKKEINAVIVRTDGKPNKKTTIIGMEMHKEEIDEAVTGNDVGLLLRGAENDDVQRGFWICQDENISTSNRFIALIFILDSKQGGRRTGIKEGYKPQIFMYTLDQTGTVVGILNDNESYKEYLERIKDKSQDGESNMILPGTAARVLMEMQHIIPLGVGETFILREGGKTIGTGKIIEVLPKSK